MVFAALGKNDNAQPAVRKVPDNDHALLALRVPNVWKDSRQRIVEDCGGLQKCDTVLMGVEHRFAWIPLENQAHGDPSIASRCGRGDKHHVTGLGLGSSSAYRAHRLLTTIDLWRKSGPHKP